MPFASAMALPDMLQIPSVGFRMLFEPWLHGVNLVPDFLSSCLTNLRFVLTTDAVFTDLINCADALLLCFRFMQGNAVCFRFYFITEIVCHFCLMGGT